MRHSVPSWAWTVPTEWSPHHPSEKAIADQVDTGGLAGVPIGGVGTGAINRGPHGGFVRHTLRTGVLDPDYRAENGFALWQRTDGGNQIDVAALRPAPKSGPMRAWNFRPDGGTYSALYPKAWHQYPALSGQVVAASIEQISPVYPDAGLDASLPVGVFRVNLENTGNVSADAAIMFSFANPVGLASAFPGRDPRFDVAGRTAALVEDHGLLGIRFTREMADEALGETDGEALIGVVPELGFEISGLEAFAPERDAERLWRQFRETGTVWLEREAWVTGGGFSEHPAPSQCGALAAKCTLQPGQVREIAFCLVWDFPVVVFGQGRRRLRRYTELFGAEGRSSSKIAKRALSRAKTWSEEIDIAHKALRSRLPVSDDSAAMIANSLSLAVEGYTTWTASTKKQAAHFGLIECPDYPLYNTLDLWSYAAQAIRYLSPDIARSVVADFADTILATDETPRHHLLSDAVFPRLIRGAAPHDLGEPREDPWVRTNAYAYQDSGRWKDLNSHFVLTAWGEARDADTGFAKRIFGAVEAAIAHLASFDRDGDDLIENDGLPDQTFDNIPMSGPSAYCNGLWIAGLAAAAAIARRAEETEQANAWEIRLAAAQSSFEAKLWTGTHYRFDTGGRYAGALFSEQLYGPALAKRLGLGDLVPIDNARQALRSIYKQNFLSAGKGEGVVSVTEDGKPLDGLQRAEVLVGCNFSFAAQCHLYGLNEEAAAVLNALKTACIDDRGVGFTLPAAFQIGKPMVRAPLNMRTLAGFLMMDQPA